MNRKQLTTKQIINKSREMNIELVKRKNVPKVCRKLAIPMHVLTEYMGHANIKTTRDA